MRDTLFVVVEIARAASKLRIASHLTRTDIGAALLVIRRLTYQRKAYVRECRARRRGHSLDKYRPASWEGRRLRFENGSRWVRGRARWRVETKSQRTVRTSLGAEGH